MKVFRLVLLLTLTLSWSVGCLVGCTKKGDDKDNTVNMVIIGNLKGMDPVNANDSYQSYVCGQIHDTLLRYHYLKRPLELIPSLAESMPVVSKDGLTVTVKIKPGQKFNDDPCFKATGGKSREIVADDFIYSMKRLADPANASEGFWVLDGKVKGLNEWKDLMASKKATYDTPVEGLHAPDPHTLVVKLKVPYFQLLYVLTMTYTAPVPRECVEHYGQEFLNHPVGAGPYQLESWTRNSKVVLKRNMNYRPDTYPTEGEPSDAQAGLLADAGKPIPFADKVTFSEIIEDQPKWLNFMKGNLDWAGIPKDNYDNVIKDRKVLPELEKKGVKVYISEDPDIVYTAFNLKDPFLGKNKLVRQAMSLAINRPNLMEKFYNNRVIPAQSPIPPGIDGYDPNYKNPYTEYSVEKAKELLKQAGFPEGKGIPELTYDATSSATGRQFGENFQQDMAAIGIKIAVKTSTWPEFQKRIKERKVQIWGMAWVGDYPDAENFLQLYYGPNGAPGPNGMNYSNKKYDELYEKSKMLPPGGERTKLYQQMRDIVNEDVPMAYTVHRIGYRTYHSWLKNFKYHEMIHNFGKYLKVDAKERAEGKDKL